MTTDFSDMERRLMAELRDIASKVDGHGARQADVNAQLLTHARMQTDAMSNTLTVAREVLSLVQRLANGGGKELMWQLARYMVGAIVVGFLLGKLGVEGLGLLLRLAAKLLHVEIP